MHKKSGIFLDVYSQTKPVCWVLRKLTCFGWSAAFGDPGICSASSHMEKLVNQNYQTLGLVRPIKTLERVPLLHFPEKGEWGSMKIIWEMVFYKWGFRWKKDMEVSNLVAELQKHCLLQQPKSWCVGKLLDKCMFFCSFLWEPSWWIGYCNERKREGVEGVVDGCYQLLTHA